MAREAASPEPRDLRRLSRSAAAPPLAHVTARHVGGDSVTSGFPAVFPGAPLHLGGASLGGAGVLRLPAASRINR